MRNSSARKYRGVEVALSLCTGTITTKNLNQKIDVIIDVLEVAPQLLNIPGNIRVVIRPIKGTTMGRYFNYKPVPLIEVDPRYPMDAVVETIMHELVHAEQYFTKKLDHSWDGRMYWNGVQHENVKPPVDRQAYRALPWEAEAFERMGPLADQVLALLNRRSIKTETITTITGNGTVQVQSKAPAVDPDAELRVELREALLAEGKYSKIVIENLVQGDVLNQARRLGLI